MMILYDMIPVGWMVWEALEWVWCMTVFTLYVYGCVLFVLALNLSFCFSIASYN